jgi:hypothetical protein
MGGSCSTNGGEEDCVGVKARGKETTMKTKMWTGLVWPRIGTGGELL